MASKKPSKPSERAMRDHMMSGEYGATNPKEMRKASPMRQTGKPMNPRAGMPGMAKKGGKKGKGC